MYLDTISQSGVCRVSYRVARPATGHQPLLVDGLCHPCLHDLLEPCGHVADPHIDAAQHLIHRIQFLNISPFRPLNKACYNGTYRSISIPTIYDLDCSQENRHVRGLENKGKCGSLGRQGWRGSSSKKAFKASTLREKHLDFGALQSQNSRFLFFNII